MNSTDHAHSAVDLGGLEVSPIGFGGMALSHVYGGIDRADAARVLREVIDAGVTFVDTADVYGEPRPGTTGPAGTNEELVGEVIAPIRDRVQLATKFGITGAVGTDGTPVRGDRAYVRDAAEASLRRLGVDHIDLYYMHRRDLGVPIEETVGAMAELVEEGKVGRLGLSEVTADELRAAAAVHPIAAVQSEWSLWSRDVEAHVVPAAAELGIGFVPYSPLGRGFLTGTMTRESVQQTVIAGAERFGEHFDANQAVVEQVRAVAEELHATPAQVALVWLLHQARRFDVATVPIPGSRRVERTVENLGALTLELSEDQVARLDRVADLAVGGRNIVADPRWISSGRE